MAVTSTEQALFKCGHYFTYWYEWKCDHLRGWKKVLVGSQQVTCSAIYTHRGPDIDAVPGADGLHAVLESLPPWELELHAADVRRRVADLYAAADPLRRRRAAAQSADPEPLTPRTSVAARSCRG